MSYKAFDRYDTAKMNKNYLMTDYFVHRELFENYSYEVKAKFSELLHPVFDTPPSRNSSLQSSGSGNSNHTPKSHTNNTHIKLPTIALPAFEGETCSLLHKETHLRH